MTSRRVAIDRAAKLAKIGRIKKARAIVAANPGPLAVIEVGKPALAIPGPLTIQPRNRVAHRTTPRLVEFFAPPFRSCPVCAANAVCMLPPVMASLQTDGTNAVCHPAHGGCNHGFAIELSGSRMG